MLIKKQFCLDCICSNGKLPCKIIKIRHQIVECCSMNEVLFFVDNYWHELSVVSPQHSVYLVARLVEVKHQGYSAEWYFPDPCYSPESLSHFLLILTLMFMPNSIYHVPQSLLQLLCKYDLT